MSRAHDIPAVRILPMSTRTPGFETLSIEDVQGRLFLRDLPRGNGRWHYQRTGLNAAAGTIVLFQFRARVVACATFLRDERFDKPTGPYHGMLVFDPASIRVFAPIDADAMHLAWPAFRAFGHVKQFLNPAGFPAFKRRWRDVRSPASAKAPTTRPAPGSRPSPRSRG